MKTSLFVLSLGLALLGFGALLAAPAEAAAGARQGLEVCGTTLLPSLFPFLVGASLLHALGLPRLLARRAGGLTETLFGVPGAAAGPLLLGLTGGYPLGAAAVAELVRRGDISRTDGERALAFCNNTGPAFIVGAAGAGCFGSTAAGLRLYLCHALAAVAVGALLNLGRPRRGRVTSPPLPADALPDPPPFPAALTDSVRGAVTAALNICGFVVLFSALAALADASGACPAGAAWLSRVTGLELRAARALLRGILELGGGVAALRGLPPTPGNLALAGFVLGFGSLSVHCQTLAVTAGAGLNCGRHFAGRLLHGLIAAGLCLVFDAAANTAIIISGG